MMYAIHAPFLCVSPNVVDPNPYRFSCLLDFFFFFFFSHLEQLFSVSFCFVLFLPFSVKEVGITLHKGAPSLVRLIASRRF